MSELVETARIANNDIFIQMLADRIEVLEAAIVGYMIADGFDPESDLIDLFCEEYTPVDVRTVKGGR